MRACWTGGSTGRCREWLARTASAGAGAAGTAESRAERLPDIRAPRPRAGTCLPAGRAECRAETRLPGVPTLQGHCHLPVLRTGDSVTGGAHGNHG